MLSLTGDKRASAHATAIVALERKMAQIQWSKEANRDAVKVYNPMTVKELAAKAPGVDWKAFLDAGEMPVPKIISISQPSYVVGLAKLIDATPLETWKVYLRMRLLDDLGGVLPQPYRDARFAFRGTALQG